MSESDRDFNHRLMTLLGVALLLALGAALAVWLRQRQSQQLEDMATTQAYLRQINDAATAYMLQHGVTRVTYGDLYATGTDGVLAEPQPVRGEDYHQVTIYQDSNQLSISWRDGTVVTYDR